MTAILVHYVRISKNDTSIEETVDGERYLFDSQNCIAIFENPANLYGQELSLLVWEYNLFMILI